MTLYPLVPDSGRVIVRTSHLAFVLVGALALGACGASTTSSSSSQTATATSAASEAATTQTAQALAELDGVTNVEPIDTSASKVFAEKYLVTFEQPLDHKDPSAGTFPQRVEVGIIDGAKANVMNTDGYLLFDKAIAMDDASELCSIANANYIHVEHRFFGKSLPANLSNDSAEGWEYLTSENAAADYHCIYSELSKVLAGPWIGTGASRGGTVCASYAYYHPEDMAIYVPYVAPFSNGPEDPRVYEYVYTRIGDEKYGADQAKAFRDLVTSFQVELMKNKQDLAPMLLQTVESQGSTYRAGVSAEKLFDMVVLELALQEWQYSQDESTMPQADTGFSGMRAILDMPDDTDEERSAKIAAELQFLLLVASPQDWSSNTFWWPYYVGAATQYGQYHYDFSYLREACTAAGIPEAVTVTPEEEDGFLFELVFTPEQQKAFVYDNTFIEQFNSWIDTTPTKLVFIYGSSDPWYALHIHDTDNANVKVFVNDKKPHSATIGDFDEATSQEIARVISEALPV